MQIGITQDVEGTPPLQSWRFGSSWVGSLTDLSQRNSLFTSNLSILEVLSAFNASYSELGSRASRSAKSSGRTS